jgi:hypothetical protein
VTDDSDPVSAGAYPREGTSAADAGVERATGTATVSATTGAIAVRMARRRAEGVRRSCPGEGFKGWLPLVSVTLCRGQ